MYCSSCGKKIDEGSLFCLFCGAKAEGIIYESAQKQKYCDVCGRLIEDDPIIPFGEKELCEECWLKFRENGIEEDNGLDKKIVEILEHKEEYTREKLVETLSYLKGNGNEKEALELEKYIKSCDINMEETAGVVYSKGRAYKKSRGNAWIQYLKIVCYIFWALVTLICMVVGNHLGYEGAGAFIGGIIGFIIGFVIIAVVMLNITMAENVATITDRVTEILVKLEEK